MDVNHALLSLIIGFEALYVRTGRFGGEPASEEPVSTVLSSGKPTDAGHACLFQGPGRRRRAVRTISRMLGILGDCFGGVGLRGRVTRRRAACRGRTG